MLDYQRPIPGAEPAPKQEKQVEKKKSSGNIWRNRPKTNDSNDFYDTEACLNAAFDEDIRVGTADGRLMRAIAQAEKKLEDDEDGTRPTDFEALKAAFRPYLKYLYRLFKYYAAVGCQTDASNNATIGKTGFSALVDRCKLDQPNSQFCTVPRRV